MTKTLEISAVPKLCGADVELGNFILGLEHRLGSGAMASRALLREIEGYPGERLRGGFPPALASGARLASFGRRDWGRKFLSTNGGCVYIDSDHLELCLPEVLSAYDHVAAWHAMLRVARGAQAAANQKLPEGQKIQVLVNNSDGLGNSYGSHLNFLVTRSAWENLFERKLHQLLFLAAYQVSSIVFTGQGKVGSENGAPHADFQLSQRADFFETIAGIQTTYARPLVNSRDEALCGSRAKGCEAGLARLHVIFFDSNLSQPASLLKVGVMQILLAMIEAERMDPGLILDDPLAALAAWSRDPSLEARARLATGAELTAVEAQFLFLEAATRFAERGGCDGVVPRFREILTLWEDTLLKLQSKEFDALAPRLDWVLKLSILERAKEKRPELGWASPELKHLDHLYSSLDPEEGLYWAFEGSGLVERVVDEESIERFVQQPPEDTRAWTRSRLLREGGVSEVDWDFVRLEIAGEDGRRTSWRVDLASPLAFTREETESLFAADAPLRVAVEALGGRRVDSGSEELLDLRLIRGVLVPGTFTDN
jgi:proteasome accessory factor A